ncbi:MAG: 16S rRNA (uracil(1498)-N(3))-methyltransferase [Bacteroidales bacterium]|nr:16S rRNA (uracil(1498)-N(3))-methyltransferase [Bacteroidales bacterium]
MTLFYCQDIDSDTFSLPAQESHHCIRVLRMTVGDQLYLTDGRGTMCLCRIVCSDSTNCLVEVIQRDNNYGKRPYHLHIAVAPTKNNARIEWLVEKAVEIGVDEITPIICDHSERGILKTDRLEKIAISAMKQSLKAYLPLINPATPLRQFVSRPIEGQRMVCYCEGDQRIPLSQTYQAGSDAVILIGPEGDFSPDEITTAIASGFQPITLGDARLRTETAALYAITAINFMNT